MSAKPTNKIKNLNINLLYEIISYLPYEDILNQFLTISKNFASAIKKKKVFQYVKQLISSGPMIINNAHSDEINSIIQLNDYSIASSSNDTTIKILNIFTNECINTIKDNHPIYAIEKINENQLASGNRNGKIKVWNLHTGELVKTLKGHSSWVNQIIKLNNDRIVSCSDDSTIKIWDLLSAECLLTFEEHTGIVRALLILNQNLLLSASDDKTIKLWQLDSQENKSLKTFEGHENQVYCLSKIDETTFFSGSYDATIRRWSIESGECLKVYYSLYAIRSLLRTRENEIILGGVWGEIKKFNTTSGELIKKYKKHSSCVKKMIKLWGQISISCSSDKTIMIQKI